MGESQTTDQGDEGGGVMPISRGTGTTATERHLAKLCDQSFLKLWSYPNPYIDKKLGGCGAGKELCDILVVCGNDVLVFSDKSVQWQDNTSTEVAWKRWYKRAIEKSARQVRGAERWLRDHPDKIYLDPECQQRLPIELPPREKCRIHGIVVARGAGDACKNHFGAGIGSLAIAPNIRDSAHWKSEPVLPFVVGEPESSGSFIHVLDDATLEIALQELDTITDFTTYLSKKVEFIRSGKMVAAQGEEDLIAWYMTRMNTKDEHDFSDPNDLEYRDQDRVIIEPGVYENLQKNIQYTLKKKADRISYTWDSLIDHFTRHILDGTLEADEHYATTISTQELAVRYMALVPRLLRRFYADCFMTMAEEAPQYPRMARVMLPGPTERNRETGFFFLTLSTRAYGIDGDAQLYRNARKMMLETYALHHLNQNRFLKRIIGMGFHPKNDRLPGGTSEDLIYAEQPNWTEEALKNLEHQVHQLNIGKADNARMKNVQWDEFPNAD